MSSKTKYHYPDGSVTFDPTLIVTGTGTPSRIEQLERENAALREDKERLEWLDADCEVIILTAKDGYELIGHNAFFAVEQKGTLRAAIDAARKEVQS